MRTGLIWILGASLFAASPIFAQAPPLVSEADVPPGMGIPVREPDTYQYWVRAEYLAYWVKNAPLPFSLVTGSAANPTQELLNTSQSLGMFSGYRAGLGAWFDPYNTVGMEGNYFALQNRTRNFSTASDAAGTPTLAFPFTSQTPGAVGDSLLPITMPGVFAGNVLVTSTFRLWGAEANSIFSLMNEGGFNLVALVGFRYVDLRENLNISTESADILVVPNTFLSQSDQFSTHNQFYGGQVGVRLTWETDSFGIDLTGKFAVGATHQTIDIQGSSTQTGPGVVNGTFPGGFFTQNSNIGHYDRNQFSMIPAVELKFSYFLTSQIRLFAGYDFMYWSQVVRPGSQVDRNINLTQSAVLGGGNLIGSAYPMALFNRSDFWAQGLNVGLEFRF